MDGNRRWAQKNGVSLSQGVIEGLNKAQTAVDFCLAKQIPYLSLYAFAIENFKRSPVERECIFELLNMYGKKYATQLAAQGVHVDIVGDRSLFPDHVKDVCALIEQITGSGTALTVKLLFCYGGRQEIIAGVKQVCKQSCSYQINIEDLTEETFKKYLWLGDIPDPDLVIRTGFAHRLSGFLLFAAAYSELYFPDCLWPDMTMERFELAFEYYKSCKRNFGV
jgi:undecaprenyl diphosphate synthase